MAQKLKKAKARKTRGVKASGSGGTKSGSVPGAGRGRGAVHLFPVTTPKPESVQLPVRSSESSDTEEESDEGTLPPSRSPKEGKPDQLALSPVIPPQGLSTPGGITATVADNPVLTQDPSPVLNDTRPSSSTPVKQEGTATQTLQVSAEVHVVSGPEQDTADASEDLVGALSCMSLGTQVSSELSHQRDPSLSPPRSTVDDSVPCLTLDLAKPVAELVGQMRAQLSPSQGLVPDGMRVPPLSTDDVVVVGQWIDRVGLAGYLFRS